MKYVIIGGAGNISKPVTEKLLAAGQQVTVVGRNAKHLEGLVAQGAKAAIGSVEDVDFLIKTFAGADAVYTMAPPDFGATDWKASIEEKGKNYAKAIKANNIRYVVNLSSIGAHLAEGAGPISGIHRAEEALNKLTDVNIKHLRPGYFFTNLLSNVEPAKNLNIMGSNFGGQDFKLVMANPGDIADVVAEELLIHNFTGHSVRYIASDERTTDDIAKVLGDAIGKPALKWVVFSDTDALNSMVQAGLPYEIAKNYAEMGHALHTGIAFEDYWKNRPASLQKTKLEDFAKTFAAVYNTQEVPVHG
jgi:uncharacterized protein YbjT (DUF2867 family)